MNVVEIENIVVRYRNAVALDGVTLYIGAERFSGIIGPNGGGKTTLLRAMLGLVKPESGDIRVFGHPPGQSHSMIGYVPQSINFDLNFPITVREVVMMGRYGRLGGPLRMPGKKDREAVDEAIERLQITKLADKRFGSLSGGERQKVLIARAMSGQPRLLLLDEPTTGVDVPAQDNFYALLHAFIRELKMSIILVSHDVGVITTHVDDLICVNQKVFCHGPPVDVIQDGLMGKAYGCETEILMHGHSVPHRLVTHHEHGDGR